MQYLMPLMPEAVGIYQHMHYGISKFMTLRLMKTTFHLTMVKVLQLLLIRLQMVQQK